MQPRVQVGIGPALLDRHDDFLHQLPEKLAALQRADLAAFLFPLGSHDTPV